MNTTELKALAEAVKGWKLRDVLQTPDDKDEGIAFVGHQSDVGIFDDIVHIDTGNYMQPHMAIVIATYYAAANPDAMLALIADLESAQDERRALLVNEQNLREKAERWDFLAERMLAADFDYAGEGVQAIVFEMPAGFSASADAAQTVDAARALLEKTV